MPMGPGGTAVDLKTGKPVVPPKPEERINKARPKPDYVLKFYALSSHRQILNLLGF